MHNINEKILSKVEIKKKYNFTKKQTKLNLIF